MMIAHMIQSKPLIPHEKVGPDKMGIVLVVTKALFQTMTFL